MLVIQDSRLVERTIGGDELAFSVLVERYRARVARYLEKLVHDHHLAQDLCQEVFMRAFESLSKLHHRRAFKSWIYRIAFHIAIDHMRRRPRRLASLDDNAEPFVDVRGSDYVGSDNRSIPPHESHDEVLGLVRQAMTTLPAATSHAIDARYRRNLSCREIAREMGWSVANAKVRLHRGRRAIRRHVTRTAPQVIDELLDSPSPATRDVGRVKLRF